MENTKALIIGAGPSGLALAYALQGETLILEKEDEVGGLCRSVYHGCGVFDIGGHSFHTPHLEVYELIQALVPEGLYLQRREARVYSHGVLIPYPFQKFYERLPDPLVVRECEQGLTTAIGEAANAEDFEDYIIRKFGTGIAEHFMLPYNRKLWARDLRSMSVEWTSERVAGAKGEREQFDTSGGDRKPLQADTRVGYPPRGGYQEIYRSFLPHVPAVRTQSEVTQIDPISRVATTADGRRVRWEVLISTMPLPLLLEAIADSPEQLTQLANQLEYMSLREEFILVNHHLDSLIQRIYIADPNIPPHKIALNHNSSAHLRERPCHGIMAEVSVSSTKKVDLAQVHSKTVQFLCDIGVLGDPSEVIWHGHMDVKHAYPVYTRKRPGIVQAIKDWLAQYDIYTLGRFGEWEYINSDECVYRGLALARELRARFTFQD